MRHLVFLIFYFAFFLFQAKGFASQACLTKYISSTFSIRIPMNDSEEFIKAQQGIQTLHSNGLIFKFITLKGLSQNHPLYQVAKNYLLRDYPNSLKKNDSFIERLNETTLILWENIHLLLMFDNKSLNIPIAGAAFFVGKTNSGPLAPFITAPLPMELEKGIHLKSKQKNPHIPMVEIGRLSLSEKAQNRRNKLKTLLNVLHQITSNSEPLSEYFTYTSKKLLQFYSFSGYRFLNFPEYENHGLISHEDVISQLILELP
jgi:hypothetical protein